MEASFKRGQTYHDRENRESAVERYLASGQTRVHTHPASPKVSQNHFVGHLPGDSRQAGSISYSTFVSILNPSATNTAHVQITYYSHGSVVETDTVVIGPLKRGTGISKLH